MILREAIFLLSILASTGQSQGRSVNQNRESVKVFAR